MKNHISSILSQRADLHSHQPPVLSGGWKHLLGVEGLEELLVEKEEEPCLTLEVEVEVEVEVEGVAVV